MGGAPVGRGGASCRGMSRRSSTAWGILHQIASPTLDGGLGGLEGPRGASRGALGGFWDRWLKVCLRSPCLLAPLLLLGALLGASCWALFLVGSSSSLSWAPHVVGPSHWGALGWSWGPRGSLFFLLGCKGFRRGLRHQTTADAATPRI